jgi:2,3-bisphosphoglycerate-dependent phosphoglycerate mutase
VDLIWVRHAEPERVESGSGVPANPSLTARGVQQAERLADWLAHERVDLVVSSPQRRAVETASPVAHAHGVEIEIVEGLVEYDVQSDHYIPVEELREKKDDRWMAMVEGRWSAFGGEDPDDFRARVGDAIDKIVAANAGRKVVAVCHGGVINVAFASVLGLAQPLWFDPGYTSISRMAAARSGVRSVVSLNERSHLDARREP